MYLRLSALVKEVKRRWVKREARGLLAARIYEDATQEDEGRWLACCEVAPELNEELAAFTRLSRELHLPGEALPIDLLPGIRVRLAETAPARVRSGMAPGLLVAAVALVLFGVALYPAYMLHNGMTTNAPAQLPDTGMRTIARIYPEVEEETVSLEQAADEACLLVSQSDVQSAILLLEHMIDAHPRDAFAGEAQLILADLEYSYLQRYDQAHAAYARLREEYHNVFESNEDSIKRLNLLDENRPLDYTPLFSLDYARKQPENAFVELERLIVQYPVGLLSEEALTEMGMLLSPKGQIGRDSMMQVLWNVRNHCSDPIAIDRLDLALGHICNDMNDRECAREHYARAAKSAHSVLAAQARNALGTIE